jgi:hypothetical protein
MGSGPIVMKKGLGMILGIDNTINGSSNVTDHSAITTIHHRRLGGTPLLTNK